MKKSFPVNINGQIFYFDEDAYTRLNTYYTNLRHTFTTEDGTEIVQDIENRIAEIIIDERSQGPYSVINIEAVDDLITRMGQPEELADNNDETPRPGRSTPPPYHGTGAQAQPIKPQRKLYRNVNNKVIAGVISGLAQYLNVNVTALRIIVVILSLFSYLWPAIILYIIGWLLIPAAETPRQMLEMRGESVTVDSIGKSTIQGMDNGFSPDSKNTFFRALGRIFSVTLMSFLGFLGLILGFVMAVVMIMSVSGILSYSIWGTTRFLPYPDHPMLGLVVMFLLSLVFLIPAVAATWAACCTLFKARGVSRRTAIILAVIEFVLIVLMFTFWRVVVENHPGMEPSKIIMSPLLNVQGIDSCLISLSVALMFLCA